MRTLDPRTATRVYERHANEPQQAERAALEQRYQGYGYSRDVIARALLHWDELAEAGVPHDHIPTTLQLVRMDIEAAVKRAHQAGRFPTVYAATRVMRGDIDREGWEAHLEADLAARTLAEVLRGRQLQ